jgi:hypothetical protein
LFFQLDRRLDYVINVQMASQLPAIKPQVAKRSGSRAGLLVWIGKWLPKRRLEVQISHLAPIS